LISAVLLLGSAAAAESRFFLGAGANYIRPADENYRAVYGWLRQGRTNTWRMPLIS